MIILGMIFFVVATIALTRGRYLNADYSDNAWRVSGSICLIGSIGVIVIGAYMKGNLSGDMHALIIPCIILGIFLIGYCFFCRKTPYEIKEPTTENFYTKKRDEIHKFIR